jgi:hypothetical protein
VQFRTQISQEGERKKRNRKEHRKVELNRLDESTRAKVKAKKRTYRADAGIISCSIFCHVLILVASLHRYKQNFFKTQDCGQSSAKVSCLNLVACEAQEFLLNFLNCVFEELQFCL